MPSEQDLIAQEHQRTLPQWKQIAGSALQGGVDALRGFLGAGSDSKAELVGQLVAAGLPVKSLLHSWDDIKRIASGSGPIRLYHGTTADNADNILRYGVQLPESGEAAARKVADLYGIPWSEWQHRVEPGTLGAMYGDATRRLSTAPYPIAHRWSQGFPQGEIYSDLNAKARLYAEAKRRGIPYDDFYNQAGDSAEVKGLRSIYKYADAVDAPDLMKQSNRPGVVLTVDTDVRAIKSYIQNEAKWYLKDVADRQISPIEALKYWNNQYKDIKIAPQNIKNIERVK